MAIPTEEMVGTITLLLLQFAISRVSSLLSSTIFTVEKDLREVHSRFPPRQQLIIHSTMKIVMVR